MTRAQAEQLQLDLRTSISLTIFGKDELLEWRRELSKPPVRNNFQFWRSQGYDYLFDSERRKVLVSSKKDSEANLPSGNTFEAGLEKLRKVEIKRKKEVSILWEQQPDGSFLRREEF